MIYSADLIIGFYSIPMVQSHIQLSSGVLFGIELVMK